MISLNQALKSEAIIFGSKDTVVVPVNNAGIEQAVITREDGNFTVAIPNTKITFNDFASVSSFLDQLRSAELKKTFSLTIFQKSVIFIRRLIRKLIRGIKSFFLPAYAM